jgi:hypothetical protein
MKSHFSLNGGGVAVACAVAGVSSMMINGNCAAQTFIAADYATNSTYASGWSAGQNGGYGFGPWYMNGTYASSPQNAIDGTSPYDPFGVAWTLYNPVAPPAGSPNPPDSVAPTGDISRAGRAIPNDGLQVGQTFHTIIANPTERHFYKGYTIRLVNGAENTSYGGASITQLSVGTFDYYVPGGWETSETFSTGGTGLFDTDTTTNGMEVDVTMTDTNSYHLVMTPLDNPGNAYTEDGTFVTNAPVNWIQYELYNTDSDFYNFTNGIPSVCANPQRTDFYIQSMTITGPPPFALNIQMFGSNVILSWPTNVTASFLESTFNLGTAAVWNTNSTVPTVINGQNVVTNPIAGVQQFYRLQQ